MTYLSQPDTKYDELDNESGIDPAHKTFWAIFFLTESLAYLTLFISPLVISCDIILRQFETSLAKASEPYTVYWLVAFFSLTSLSTILLIWRRNEHPLRARCPGLLYITAIGAVGMSLWTGLGFMGYEMSCAGSHWAQNIFYPMFILPYFFRAQRVITIFSQARRFHDHTLSYSEQNDQKNRIGFGCFSDDNLKGILNSTSSEKSSNSLLRKCDDGETSFEEEALKRMKGAIEHWANQPKLLLWFAVYMVPFVVLSIIDTLLNGKTHILPSISAGLDPSSPSESCDLETHGMKVMTIGVWITIHTIEAIVFAYYYRRLNMVLKEFHTQQEFAIIFIAEVIYDLIFIALLISSAKLDFLTIARAVDYVVMSRSAFFICVTILWPTYSTFFGTQAPMFPNRAVLRSLHNVLQDPLALKYFYNYIENDETSSVLLQFWMEVEMFRQNIDDQEATGSCAFITGQHQTSYQARKLFHCYFEDPRKDIDTFLINPDPERQMEIMMRIVPRAIVEEILGEIEKCERGELLCTQELFEDAQIISFQLLQKAYRLFLRSKECKDLLYHFNGEEILFKALIEYKVI